MARHTLAIPTRDPNVRVIPPERSAIDGSADVRPAARSFPWPTIAVCALLMALYTGSPIDLIPDFIPLAGQLDDLLVNAGLLGVIGRAVIRYYALRHLTRGGVKTFFKRAFMSRLAGRFFRRK